MSVYLEAAQLVDAGHTDGSCWAVADAARYRSVLHGCREVLPYEFLFAPENRKAWWGLQWSDDPDEVRECRVLALLFMHWMTR